MIEVGKILQADGNEYTLVDKIIKDNNTYLYLSNINEIGDFIFGKLEGEDIVLLNDPDELEMALKQFNADLHNFN